MPFRRTSRRRSSRRSGRSDAMDDAFGLPPARPGPDDDAGSAPTSGSDEQPTETTVFRRSGPLSGRRRGGIIAVAVAAVALLAGGGIGAAHLVGRGEGGRATAVATSSVTPPADASRRAPTPGASTPDTPRTSRPVPLVTPIPPPVAAVVPGWQTVEGREFVAYDVPPDWRVEGGDQLTGYEYHDPSDARLVVMHNVASYLPGVCPGRAASNRARTGFVVPAELGPHEAAPELSARWASVAALDQGGREAVVSPTQTVTTVIADGTITATESTTLVSFPVPAVCQAGGMAFTAVSFEVKGEVVVFMIHTDERVADSLAPVVVNRVIASLRPVG